MNLRPEDYSGKPRDSRRENYLVRNLIDLPEQEAFLFIQEILQQDHILGLVLAKRVLRNKRFFRSILGQGLKGADASEIRWWLECCIPKMGFRQVVRLVEQETNTNLLGAEKALYWLPQLIPPGEPKSVEALVRLRDRVKQKHSQEKS